MGATSIQELNGYVHRSVDVVLGLSNYILAALMVAFGAVQLIYAYTDEYTTLTWLLALSYIVMLVGGAVIILDRNRIFSVQSGYMRWHLVFTDSYSLFRRSSRGIPTGWSASWSAPWRSI